MTSFGRRISKKIADRKGVSPLKKHNVPLHRYLISMICVAIISAGISRILLVKPTIVSESEAANDELIKIHELYQTIQQDYYEEVDSNVLIEGALQGMTDALDDPYTTYLKEEDSAELNDMLSGEFEGIGATLSIVEDYPEIIEDLKENSPAAKSGLLKGDRITKVDDYATKGQDLSDIVERIRGKKGSAVRMTIQRGEEEKVIEVVRDTIAIESLNANLDSKDSTIGNISIFSFNSTTAKELEQAITDLRSQGAKSFILDVRQNPGGYLDQVEKMASMFLEDGKTIVKFGLKDEIIGETVASKELDNGFKVTEPVVVIVDEQSASASEILAAALNESADIPIVGTTTFGKGTVQGMNHFSDQSELKMTVQKWLTPSGQWINKKGVTPTYEVRYPDYFYYPSLSLSIGLKEGDKQESVSHLNEYLSLLGYLKPENKAQEFSQETKGALKAFQKEQSLEVSGQLDSNTAFMLELFVFEQQDNDDKMYEKAVELLTNR